MSGEDEKPDLQAMRDAVAKLAKSRKAPKAEAVAEAAPAEPAPKPMRAEVQVVIDEQLPEIRARQQHVAVAHESGANLETGLGGIGRS